MSEKDSAQTEDGLAWLAAIRKANPASSVEGFDEHAFLREAILTHHAEEQAELLQGADDSELAWQKLRVRLDAWKEQVEEGAKEERKKSIETEQVQVRGGLDRWRDALSALIPNQLQGPRRLGSGALIAGAAVLSALVVAGAGLLLPRTQVDIPGAIHSEPPILRGAEMHLSVPDPESEARQLFTFLKTVDPNTRLYWYEGAATFDFSVSKEQVLSTEERLNALPFSPPVRLSLGTNRVTVSGSK